MSEASPIYHIVLRVRPTPTHSRYWEVQFGYLHVWLPAVSPDDAADKISVLMKALPYDTP